MRQARSFNKFTSLRTLLAAAAIGHALLPPAALLAQDDAGGGGLDAVVRVSLRDVTLAELSDEIEAQTGLSLRITDRAFDLAPSGPATLITRADIIDVPLRDGLGEILGGLLLTLRESDRGVEVVPSPLLSRVGQRPTWEQIDLLRALQALEPGIRDADLAALRNMLQFRLQRDDPWTALSAAIRQTGAGGGTDVLTLAAGRLGWSWIVDGSAIVVLPKREAVRRALDTRISLAAKNQPFSTVLGAIGKQAGVDIRIEERAMDALPLGVQRRFSITLRNKPLGEVLESIGTYTSLAPVVTEGGILFVRERDRAWFDRLQRDPALKREEEPRAAANNAQTERDLPRAEAEPFATAPAPAPAAADADPVVARITVINEDGRRVEWLIRRSELPPDLREQRAADLQNLFDEVRRRSSGESASEKTQPD